VAGPRPAIRKIGHNRPLQRVTKNEERMVRTTWRSLAAVASAAIVALALPAIPAAQAPAREQLASKLQKDLERLAGSAPGVVGIGVVDLTNGQRFGVNDGLVFPQGSAIKIPILIELFRRADRGELGLDDSVPIRAAEQVGGSGVLGHFADGGSELSLHDLAILMIVLSDNTATNLLIERLGMDHVNATMKALGAGQTLLRRKMIRPAESAKGNENVSTPREAVDLMARLARCDLPLDARSCAEVTRILEIPKGGAFREPIPGSVKVAWKPGGLEGVQTAWGIVRVPGAPYAVTIMITYAPDEEAGTMREISLAVYRYFTQVARTTEYGTRVPLEYLEKRGPR
jgi:beta-lactamase class A